MRLAELMKKGALTGAARKGNAATVATVATDPPATVATVATVATLPDDRTPSDAVARWVLPDGREVWTSAPETLAQVQARYPSAVLWTDADTVTVTELPPEDQATIRAWLASLGETAAAIEQDIETARRIPDTAGWLLARARIDVTTCATLHACGDCQHFTHDPEAGGGIGSCAITKAGHPPRGSTGYPVCYSHALRRCPGFEKKEQLQ